LTWIDFFAFREMMIVNFLGGYLLLFLSYKFSQRHALGLWAEVIFLFSLLCLCISLQLPSLWPDFLSAVFFLLYLYLITSPRLKTSSRFYLLAGISALLCAFAKSFFSFYLIVHLFGLFVFNLCTRDNRNPLYFRNILKTIAVYLLGIAIWTGLLSWKYERFMLNSSGIYNSNLISPTGHLPHFSETSGLLPPPDQYSVNHWVDPTYYPIKKRSLTENYDSMLYQWKIMKYNLSIVYYMFNYFSFLKIGALLFMIFPFFLSNKPERNTLLLYFFSALLILGGYTFVMIQERYLQGSQLLLFIAVFITTYVFCREKTTTYQQRWVLPISLLLVSVSFLKNCPIQYLTWETNRIDFARTNLIEKELSELPFLEGKRITNGPFEKAISTLDYIAMRKHAKVWGNTNRFASESSQYKDLKKHAIDYYFYNNTHPFPSFLQKKTPVYSSHDGSIRIYSLKPY
jgi:hypothetical protein